MMKTIKMLTVLACCAACFAPATAIGIANGGLEEPVAVANTGFGQAPEVAPVPIETYTVDEVVVVAESPRKAKKSPPKAKKSCADQQLEITGGFVRVCDVPRTDNDKAGVWEPVEKPTRLASRDVPSPSGLLR
jgi:hypothetical protein